MDKLSRADLYSLEQYAEVRNDFRARVMAHKKHRNVQIGPHATLLFEDRLTMQYQIQEMLRVERIFEATGIEEELEAYNPLIPDGGNWKATFMIEYNDPAQRKAALARLIGIDRQVWVRVVNHDKVFAISNEDLERETEDKTSSVHFLRFELSGKMVEAAKQGASISAGIDHEHYHHSIDPLPDQVRGALLQDLA
ncbi:MAG: DUF3501 family protein [Gammaproteobacteria bacterium]